MPAERFAIAQRELESGAFQMIQQNLQIVGVHLSMFRRAAEEVFGCPRDQALGAPLAWFIPERFHAAHSDHIKRFGEAGVGGIACAQTTLGLISSITHWA